MAYLSRQMTESRPAPPEPARVPDDLKRIADLLGLKERPTRKLEAHDLIVHGLPGDSVVRLFTGFLLLQRVRETTARVLGLSLRTLQRRTEHPPKRLSPAESGRVWKLAEVLAKATDVMGSSELAQRWLEQPAIGLDQRRPIDVMESSEGAAMVLTLLDRLDYGVYT
jgi:putative toxin-antitoxin system antitoxin component (TIGR02293 family)